LAGSSDSSETVGHDGQYRNVTVALPADLVKEARHLAVDRGLSLSAFVATLIEEKVESPRRYEAVGEQALKRLQQGYPLGLGEKVPWTRDELHER
jgi:hypothetical protein